MLALIEIGVICLYICSHAFVCESKAINVTYTDDNDTLRLNLTSLKEVLYRPEIQNKKLMIVSIVGEMRTGKSYISGYGIRYLQNKGWANESWMGDGQTKHNGFIWGPGTETITTGIVLWDELFIIKNADGEEVVVLLLDTQGLFDFETTLENNVRMNALNFFASSILIMNFQKQLTERDLQNWQQSADFAKIASSVDKSVFELPACLMLVQNWANSHEHAFGFDGGKTYKNFALADRKNKPKLNLVRRNIASSFPSIEFFLMPHPGENVTNATTFRGTNNEVKDIYLQYVKKYVEHIFDPKNLVIKKLQGKPMNPKTYYDFLVSIDKALSSDKMPTVQDLTEAFATSVYSEAHDRCLEEFEIDMKGHADTKKIIGSEELEELYESHKKLSMQCYYISSEIRGSPELRNKFANMLDRDMEIRFQTMKKDVNKKKEELLSYTVKNLFKKYKDDLDKISDSKPTNIHSFHRSHLDIRARAVESYNEKSLNCEPYVAEYRQKLLDQIDEYYQHAHERIALEIKLEQIQKEKEATEEREETARRQKAQEEAKETAVREKRKECRLFSLIILGSEILCI